MHNKVKNIPVKLLYYTFYNRFYGRTQLYIFLKKEASNGFIRVTKHLITQYIDDTGKSDRTFKNNLKELLKCKWITYNSKKKTYHIKSFKRICNTITLNQNISSGLIWEKDYLKNFTATVYATIITYEARRKRYNSKFTDINKECVKSSKKDSFLSLPYSYLGKSLRINKGQAQKMFIKAIDSKLIKIEKNLIKLNDNIPASEFYHYKKINPDIAHKLKIYKNTIYINETQKLFTAIYLKKSNIL